MAQMFVQASGSLVEAEECYGLVMFTEEFWLDGFGGGEYFKAVAGAGRVVRL